MPTDVMNLPKRNHRKPVIPFENAGDGICQWCGVDGAEDRDGNAHFWHKDCWEDYRVQAFPVVLRQAVYDRDRGRCIRCGSVDDDIHGEWDADHSVELIDGGGFHLAQVVTLCRPCHKAKTRINRTRRAGTRAKSVGSVPVAFGKNLRNRPQVLSAEDSTLARNLRFIVVAGYLAGYLSWWRISAFAGISVMVFWSAIIVGFILLRNKHHRRQHEISRAHLLIAKHTGTPEITKPKKVIQVHEWENDVPTDFTVRYLPGFDGQPGAKRDALENAISSKLGHRCVFEWDTRNDAFRVRRRHELPRKIAYVPSRVDDKHVLTVGVEIDPVTGKLAPVKIDFRRQPHMLICGTTGGGKTVSGRTVTAEALSHDWYIYAIDQKLVELAYLRGRAGVRIAPALLDIGERVDAASELIAEVRVEMFRRFGSRLAAIEAFYGDASPVDEAPIGGLRPIMLLIDEATQLIDEARQVNTERNIKGSPQVERDLWAIARLGRIADVHIVAGLQRPDAAFLSGDARNNYSARIAVGELDEAGRRMMFGDGKLGKVDYSVAGRASIQLQNDLKEIQVYLLDSPADPDSTPERRAVAARYFPQAKEF